MSARPNEGHDGKYKVQILARAVSVLAELAARTESLGLEELTNAVDVNKPSLLRILRTLEDERLVLRSEDRYQLGPRVLEFSHGYVRGLALEDVARPFMEVLAKRTNQTVSLAILDGLEVVYVAIERAQQEIGIQGAIGARHPANATALGKVLLANLEPDVLRVQLDSATLPRLTHRTISDPDVLLRHLAHVRRQGYAEDDEERGIGIRCVAAPIWRADGRAVAAVSIAGPIFHLTDDVLPAYTEWLVSAADAVSERLGRRTGVQNA